MQSHSKLIIPIIVIIIAVLGLGIFVANQEPEEVVVLPVTNFEECVEAGNPVMESYPRQCAANGVTYTEELPAPAAYNNMIRVANVQENSEIESPLVIRGEARGGWYFEATFPVVLTNWDGLIIAEGYAQADGEWMTNEFVPFTATMTYTNPNFNNRGFLILQKSNASGLPENDDAYEIPVYFKGVAPQEQAAPSQPQPVACTMEAMQCPDGSYVGRQGPKCEFAPCPPHVDDGHSH